MKRSRQIVATIFSLVCFIALSMALLLPACNKVPTENNNNNNSHTEHSYVYTKVDDDNHKKSCSGCTEVDVTEAHSYDDDQDTTCNYCDYVRTIESGEYPYTTPSGIKISADKTALKAGDTFIVTFEIEAKNKDLYWSAIDLKFCPLNAEGTSADADICSYFEKVESYGTEGMVTSLDDKANDVMLICVDDFQENRKGIRVSIAFIGEPVSTSEKITVSMQMKIKDNAPDISSFDFGVAPKIYSYICYSDETGVDVLTDTAVDSDRNFTNNKIAMSITAKAN